MTVLDLRKKAKQHNLKLTRNGKYKTMTELKNEINEFKNEINGGSMKSNYIKNIIYSKDFDPLKIKNPSKDILNKVNKQNPQIQFLKTLQTTIVKDNNELKTLKKYKDKKEVRSKLIDNLLLYRNKFKQLQKYFDINNNTILQKDANKIKKFLTNKTNTDFLNSIL